MQDNTVEFACLVAAARLGNKYHALRKAMGAGPCPVKSENGLAILKELTENETGEYSAGAKTIRRIAGLEK
jgi:hypothetical protein